MVSEQSYIMGIIVFEKGGAKQVHALKSEFISGLYYKSITIVIMMIINDATIWSVTYDRN
jgi:hypothetical protein